MSLQTRIWHHFQETFLQETEKSRRLFCDWGMQKSRLFHFSGISFTKRFHFCFKRVNNFHCSRKSAKSDQILHSSVAKKPSRFFRVQKWKFREQLSRSLGRLCDFLRKKWFCAKLVQFPPKSGNEVNGSQKTKETVTFIRVGAMGATMSFSAPKVRNFDHFAILEPEMVFLHFWEQNLDNYIFRCSWRRKGLGSCSSPKERYAFLRCFFS